jgi:hypothetical protein
MEHHLIAAATQANANALVTPGNMRLLGIALAVLVIYSILRSLGVFGNGD